MLDQEAAFLQIQEAKTMVEEDLQRRLEEFEGEREQLQKVADAAASLEQQLEQARNYCFLNPRLQRFIWIWALHGMHVPVPFICGLCVISGIRLY